MKIGHTHTHTQMAREEITLETSRDQEDTVQHFTLVNNHLSFALSPFQAPMHIRVNTSVVFH